MPKKYGTIISKNLGVSSDTYEVSLILCKTYINTCKTRGEIIYVGQLRGDNSYSRR